MAKLTTKPRKKLFYNKLEDILYVETQPGSKTYKERREKYSNFVKPKELSIIDEATILANLGRVYLDLSLFPAHIYKSYGHANALGENKLVWFFKQHYVEDNTIIKPKLIYITDIVADFIGMYTITYRTIDLNGVMSNKFNYMSIHAIYLDNTFKEVNENYQITTKITLK